MSSTLRCSSGKGIRERSSSGTSSDLDPQRPPTVVWPRHRSFTTRAYWWRGLTAGGTNFVYVVIWTRGRQNGGWIEPSSSLAGSERSGGFGPRYLGFVTSGP